MICKNCEAPLQGNYCSNCGQSAHLHPITVKQVLHDFIHAFTHADKGFLLTIKALSLRPGIVAREYIDGKRKKYFNPLSFLVLTMAVSAYLSYASGYFESFRNQSVQETTQTTPKPGKTELNLHMRATVEGAKIVIDHGKLIGLVLIAPLMAGLSWFFFRKQRYGYAEHFVLQSYLIGFSNVVRVLIFIPIHLLLPGNITIIDTVFQVVFLVYLIVAFKQFSENNLIVTILKSVLIHALFIVFFWGFILGYAYLKILLFG